MIKNIYQGNFPLQNKYLKHQLLPFHEQKNQEKYRIVYVLVIKENESALFLLIYSHNPRHIHCPGKKLQ